MGPLPRSQFIEHFSVTYFSKKSKYRENCYLYTFTTKTRDGHLVNFRSYLLKIFVSPTHKLQSIGNFSYHTVVKAKYFFLLFYRFFQLMVLKYFSKPSPSVVVSVISCFPRSKRMSH